jgi:hypothetical protein
MGFINSNVSTTSCYTSKFLPGWQGFWKTL